MTARSASPYGSSLSARARRPAHAPRASPREAVVAPVENMYSGPDAATDVVSQALLGQVVSVIEESTASRASRPPTITWAGCPRARCRAYRDPAAPRYARKGTVADVIALMANLYREPDVTAARPKAQRPWGRAWR